jgi:hypothetical protein
MRFQLADTLRLALAVNPAITTTAAAHAAGLLHDGFTIAQVVWSCSVRSNSEAPTERDWASGSPCANAVCA